MRTGILVSAILLSTLSPVSAEKPPKSVSTISPIFGQLVQTGLPRGFVPAFEKTQQGFYIREAVLAGESVNNWTQAIAVTGGKDLATKSGVTPMSYLNAAIGGFKTLCPFSFATQIINQNKVSGFDAVAAVVSCGTVARTARKTSESSVIVVIKGLNDFYTVQWSERGNPSVTPLPIDAKKWSDRLSNLSPIKLCPIVQGEKPPYPSCVGSGL